METPINNLPESYRAVARAAPPTTAPAVEPAGIVPGLPRQWRVRYRGPRSISWRQLEAAAENGYLTYDIVLTTSDREGFVGAQSHTCLKEYSVFPREVLHGQHP